tara:strand:- start:785 stop:1012 length:228 start_codon:yes stop_codon:yes gene_type:complete
MERSEMKPEVQDALAVLDTITPNNLHLKTNATWGQRVDFESLWFNHSAQSARYYLLPSYWDKTLLVVNEPTLTHS